MDNFLTKIRLCSKQATLFVLFSLLGVHSVYAVDFAVDVHGGSNGVGLGGAVGINSLFAVRAGINSYEVSENYEEDGIDYTADFEFDNQYLLLDFHPFANAFRITAGLYFNDNNVSGSAEVGVGDTIGEGLGGSITFLNDGLASVNVEYDSSTAVYVGVGFGKAASNNGGFGFSLDLGIIDAGSFTATADLDENARSAARNAGFSDAQIQAAIDAEAAEVNSEFDDLDGAWPLLQIGISYGF